MDIKLVKNIEEGMYTSIKEQVLLQTVDDNYRLGEFNGKKMYILNSATNERFEVLPHIKKYSMSEISYASYEHNYFVFTSAEHIREDLVRIVFYMYNIDDESVKIIRTIETSLQKLQRETILKMFVLDENFSIFESIKYTDSERLNSSLISKGLGEHKLYLYSIEDEEELPITNGAVAASGIDRIIPLHGNVCAIKIGSSVLEEQMYDDINFANEYQEIIGLINVKQFISDLRLNQENVYIDTLDECDENTTLPYMIQYGNELVYSKVDVKKRIEEVIIYDYVNKIKKVRLNSNISKISDLQHTYILDDMPCVIKESEDSTEVINLNTQKAEITLDSKIKIKYILGDLIVTQRRTDRKIIKKEINYIEVFRYPDMEHPIFSTKGVYKHCIEYMEDLLIFAN